jgi:peptidoglycan/LPS O-acetylase OafA/YrhL
MLLAQSNLAPVENSRRRLALAVGAMALIGLQLVYDRAAAVLLGFGALILLLGDPAFGNKSWLMPLRAVFSCRLARFSGDASYCVYLVHGFFVAMLGGFFLTQAWYLALQPVLRVAVLTLGVTAGSYFLAAWMRVLVERPGIALGRHLARRVATGPRPVATQVESA